MSVETTEEVLLEVPITLDKSHSYAITYTYPGPLSCLSGVQRGCSKEVDAGPTLGIGVFCNYAVVCAGVTVTVFYEEFRRTA